MHADPRQGQQILGTRSEWRRHVGMKTVMGIVHCAGSIFVKVRVKQQKEREKREERTLRSQPSQGHSQ